MVVFDMSENPERSLFSVANELIRTGRFEDALLILEYLRNDNSEFSPYRDNELYARSCLAALGGAGVSAGQSLHLFNSSRLQRELRVADMLSALGEGSLVESLCYLSESYDTQFRLALANSLVDVDWIGWLGHLNQHLHAKGLGPLDLLDGPGFAAKSAFQRLSGAGAQEDAHALVTICVACFNAESYVEKSIGSLLNQTYGNIEILVFDDQSTDSTYDVASEIAARDERVKVIRNSRNQGTYLSRNDALKQAKGEFFTILDADDFAHPERIGLQVRHLMQHPDNVGVYTEWVRMHEGGRFHFRKAWGGCYQHPAVATLMFRTALARERIGYWDRVRFGADTEYLYRLRRVFGDRAVKLMRVPTVVSLYHEASLTNHPETGVSVGGETGLSPVRVAYQSHWKAWHEQARKPLFMPFSPDKREFSAPEEMLP